MSDISYYTNALDVGPFMAYYVKNGFVASSEVDDFISESVAAGWEPSWNSTVEIAGGEAEYIAHTINKDSDALTRYIESQLEDIIEENKSSV